MSVAKDALLSAGRDQGNDVFSRRNWIACAAIVLLGGSVSIYWIGMSGLMEWTPTTKLDTFFMLSFHAIVAILSTFVLGCQYYDTIPMMVRYQIPGNACVLAVEQGFVHWGRWTTFTTWCNTLAACYFWMVSAMYLVTISNESKELPRMFLLVLGVLWEISFPMGFLVNLIVSFVLIPTKKKNGDFVGLWYALKWRGQALHNGFVIVVALEAVLVSPKMLISSFPVIVLYGLAYVVFAYCLFLRTGVFHYFFLDPRWKHAPLGLVGLLGLLAGLFCVGSVAVNQAAHSWVAKVFIVVSALATCTFRDSAAIAPSTLASSTCA